MDIGPTGRMSRAIVYELPTFLNYQKDIIFTKLIDSKIDWQLKEIIKQNKETKNKQKQEPSRFLSRFKNIKDMGFSTSKYFVSREQVCCDCFSNSFSGEQL